MSVDGTTLIFSFVLIFAIASVIIYLFSYLKIVPIVGYLIAGVLIGPSVVGIIIDSELIEFLAEIGIVFLLFLIGVEFSLEEFIKHSRKIVAIGVIQVFPTTFIVMMFAYLIGLSISKSIFLGLLITMSSTAIVLKLLADRGELETTHGTLSSGICIFQDLIVVGVVLLMPMLADNKTFSILDLFLNLGKVIIFVLAIFVFARILIPTILTKIVKTQIRELFLITTILICFGVAYLSYYLGLSLELGAFIAGLVISESEYHNFVVTEILPFKDLFTGLFFISIGLLLDLEVFFDEIARILLITAFVIILKGSIILFGLLALGYSQRTSILVALSLSQIGEFSFILAKEGLELELISQANYQIILASAILSMIFTPIAIQNGNKIVNIIQKTGFFNSKSEDETNVNLLNKMNNHLILVGYSTHGKQLSNILVTSKIMHIAVDRDPELFKKGTKHPIPLIFGDATKEHILKKTNIQTAKVLVVSTSDPMDTKRVVQISRKTNPELFIIARTRFIKEIPSLYKFGANEVIADEFETSIAITTLLLGKFLVGEDEILRYIHDLRRDGTIYET